MPNSTQFMQEMTYKDQERSSWTKVCSLKRTYGRLSVQAPVSSQPVRFQGRSWKSVVRLSVPMVA